MRLFSIVLALCLLVVPAMLRADEASSVKEGFKEVHEGMVKVTKSVGRKAKKDFKAIDKQAKKDWKAVDKSAKKTWKKAGSDIQKATKD